MAGASTWWLRLFVVSVLVGAFTDVPALPTLAISVGAFALSLLRPPATALPPQQVGSPVRGTWTAINSPGSRIPSHGVKAYGQAYAVDLVVPGDGTTPKPDWSLRPRPPEEFGAFGRPVLAVADGTVIRSSDREKDHGARTSWPLIIWMMTVGGFVRELVGAPGLLGNHVILQHHDGTFSAYAHLRHGSLRVTEGDEIRRGEALAEVGNTGNTSEPHLHVQLMDDPRPTRAAGVPMLWPDVTETGRVDARWATGDPAPGALAGFPRNGSVFTA